MSVPQILQDQENIARLRRMKLVALAVLASAVVVYVFARWQESGSDAPVWGYVRAMAEAGVVGGLADWFAVTALFRHPLGIPIPHTALLPNKKDQLGESLSEFVHGNFMARGNVEEKVLAARPADRLGEYLDNPEHREWLVQQAASLATELVDSLDDSDMQLLVRNVVFTQLTVHAWAPPAGRMLGAAVADGNHEAMVDGVLAGLRTWLVENRRRVAWVVADKGPISQDGPIRWVHERLGYKAADLLIEWVNELRSNRRAPARRQLNHYLRSLAVDLQEDPRLLEQVERWKNQVLVHPETQATVGGIWPAIKDIVKTALDDPESDLRQRAQQGLADVAGRIRDDGQFHDEIDDRVAAGAGFLVERYGADAASLIAETVQNWDGEEASRKIEVAAGRDLQFIRINGTVVGSLAGLAIYTGSEFLW